MARTSPMRRVHQQAEAALQPYGPPDAPDGAVEVVATYGELELEYAALRKAAALLDQPHRGLIELRGPDRADFLNRMVTQELRAAEPGSVRHSFWLNRKGRVDADLRVITLADRTLLECDVHAAPRAIEGLSGFVITEDLTIADRTSEWHSMALHGPTGGVLLGALAAPAGDAGSPATLAPGRAWTGRLADGTAAGTEAVVFRDDACGVPGLEVWTPAAAAAGVFQQMIERGHDHNGENGSPRAAGAPTLASRVRLRPIGWHAFNIARIEAGTPLYNIDFGPESLPAETGVLHERVSFTKGCYLGQEIVARMHSRGHPKQVLIALRFDSVAAESGPFPRQPLAGAALWLHGRDPGGEDPVGILTSSTLAPMLSSAPVALGSVRFAHASPGTELSAEAEGRMVRGVVQDRLRFVGG